MRHSSLAVVFAFCYAGALTFAGGQASLPTATRDPQALTLLNQALTRLRSNPAPVTDITLTASAAYSAGSDHETGTATLQAFGAEQSRVTLNLDGGTREQVRNGIAGAWVGKEGVAHTSALHNCWADAGWFAAILILEAASSDRAVSVTLGSAGVTAGPADSHSREGGNPGVTLSRIITNQSAA
ncbi:MAG: hypothetical protein KGM47_09335, partial [Acidobacteriota bacterium]|nr:hypothetical protein [Acidobacteriota bacterium]